MAARTPAQLAAPTLTEVERIAFDGLSWETEVNRAGSIQVGCVVDKLAAPIKARLRNLDQFPTELRVHRDGVVMAAGPITGGGIQGSTLTLYARGLLYYLRYMLVTADLTYAAVDQHLIAKGLVDHWQNLDYGNFGIDTSGITASGVTRDRTYKANELPNIGHVVELLSQVDNGFDATVNPSSRALVLHHPEQGIDRTATVHLDARNITDAGVSFSVAAEDVASDAFGVGTGEEPFTAHKFDAAVRASFGRSGVGQTFDGVAQQATLDGHTQALLASRAVQWFQPAPGLFPVTDADVDDFDAGDTVSFSYDSGLGLHTGPYRVAAKRVQVDADGAETISVGFA